jgi:hypothetical protein
MSEPGNEPVQRDARRSIYSYSAGSLAGLREFVDALYAVGAIGDEPVVARDWYIKVEVDSDDLMPKPGQGPVTLRHAEYRRMRATITGLTIAVAVLGVFCIIAALVWLLT